MESIFIIFFSLIIVMLGRMLTINNIRKNKKPYLIDWAIIVFALLYGVGFPLVYLSTEGEKNFSNYAYYISQFTTIEIVYYFILTSCLMVFTKLGWHLNIRKVFKTINTNNFNTDENMSIVDYTNIRKYIKFAWIMLLISFVSYYLYAIAYGGFIGLLSYTIGIRSGMISVSNKFSFLEKFGQFSVVSTYIFFALVIDKYIIKNRKRGSLLGLIVSFAFSIYFIYSRGGRGSLVFFVMTLILTTIYYNSNKLSKFLKTFYKKLIWLPIAFIAMDRLWSRTGASSIFELFIRSISYPFAAFIVNFRDGSYRFFRDFLQAPFYFLPSSIWMTKLNFKTANAQTTYLISGAYKGESIAGRVVSGTTPNDILTFGFMQANIVGVVIIALLYGLFLRYFHNKIMKQKYNGIKYMLYSYFISYFIIILTLYGDTAHIIITNWGFIIYFFLFDIYKKIKV